MLLTNTAPNTAPANEQNVVTSQMQPTIQHQINHTTGMDSVNVRNQILLDQLGNATNNTTTTTNTNNLPEQKNNPSLNNSSSPVPAQSFPTMTTSTTTTTTTTNITQPKSDNNAKHLNTKIIDKSNSTGGSTNVSKTNNPNNNEDLFSSSGDRERSMIITNKNTNATTTTTTTTTNATTTSPTIISQLKQLQSPQPQLSVDESPITQATKCRHRGFLSQLLCCFRPTSSCIYHDPNNIYNNADVVQHHNSLTQKYSGKYLLPARKPSDNRICLVIDLDETLVHSSFKPIDNADFVVPVEIDGTLHKVYVLKRPHVDEFLKRMGQIYECVLFTASLAKYADPVADLLDRENTFKARLFRESCAFYRGNYVKDLSRLGRDLNRVIIVDNSPASYIFHPDNALPVTSYFDDESDNELLNLIPLLERIATNSGAVVPISMCYNN